MHYLDCRMLQGSGISTYLMGLIRIYKKNYDLNISYLVKNYTRVISNAPDYSNQFRFKSNIYSLHEQIFYPSILNSNDILHVPHYNAPLRFPGKLVITVHDLCHLVMKEFFKGPAKRFYSSIFMRQVLKISSVIITPSHFTKREIFKYFNIDPKKITVIHNGLDPHFYPRTINEQKTAQKANGFPCSYLLYVGNIKRHKNIKRLIQGYYKAWKQKSDLPKLFIVGQSDQGYDPYLEATSEYDEVNPDFENQVIFKGYVPYEDLPALYSGADAFIFPSLYEGFGFPPLEAMACGTPVIASNNSSLPEVLGDNALYVDPYDIHQITSSILKIYENAELLEPFINNGLKHVQQYSWEKSAEKHIEIYDRLAHKKRNILFVDQYSEYYGGGQIILIDLIKHIHTLNQWNLRVALPSSGNFSKEIKKLGIKINDCPVPVHDITRNPIIDSVLHLASSFWLAKNLYKICKVNDINILYCNGGRLFLMSWLVSKILDFQMIWHFHLVFHDRQKQLVEFLGKHSERLKIIAVSEKTKSPFQGNDLESKITILHNWIRPEFMIDSRHLSKRQQYPKMNLLNVGRISKEKGQYPMLQSLNQIPANSFQITIVGKLSNEQKFSLEFENLVNEMNKNGFSINLRGYLSDIQNEISKNDFLIVSSIIPEAFGITAIEAMARGVVVLANRQDSLSEFMVHQETGLFYDADDPQSLPNLIHEIQDHKYDLVQIRKNAYQMVKTRFYAPKQLARFQEILEETV